MNRTTVILLVLTLLGMPVAAQAVPLQIAHQGELSDATGPITDSVSLTFKLFDALTGGTEVWSETRAVDVVAGNYAVLLGGATQSNPIEDVLLQEPALFLEITVEAEAPLLPRQPVGSTPYAIHAYTAENVVGGTVDASSVSVNGTEVVDGTGQWVGAAGSIDWSALTGAPVDADTLAGLACADGSVAKFVVGTGLWTCDSDLVLTSAQVLGMVDAAQIDLGTGSQVAGVNIATVADIDWNLLASVPSGFADAVDNDALGGLSCADGMLAKWSSGSGLWECQADVDTDTVLTETQVLDFVDGTTIDLGAGSQMAGVDLATVNDLGTGGGISQADVYAVQGTFDATCIAPDRVSKAYCSDANDVLLSGWCAYTGHNGGTSLSFAQGPIDSTSAACPTNNEFQNYAPTAGGALGPGPVGWACRESSSSSALPAYALCLSVP